MRNASIIVGIGFLILAGGWYLLSSRTITAVNTDLVAPVESLKETQGAATGVENLVTFSCAGGKTITAVFERDIVALTLSDSRQITLRQAPSGSGIRYISSDSSIEFQGKGSGGALVERGETTYASCLAPDE
jgi:membrane-bound inhibitor of C-type lysozyme